MERHFAKRWLLTLGSFLCAMAVARAAEEAAATKTDDPLSPSFSLRGGYIALSPTRNFYVDSEWDLPLFWQDRFYAAFDHRDTSPFINTRGNAGTEFQVEQLHSTETLLLEYELNPMLALKSVQRYEHTMMVDRPGKIFGYEMGFGLGTPDRLRDPPLQWTLAAGPVFKVQSLNADWFALGQGSLRVWRLRPPPWAPNAAEWRLSLDADVESVNEGGRVNPMVELGPTLRLPTTGGSQMDVFAHWIRNYDNPFNMAPDGGLLVGLRADSWGEPQWGHDALDFQAGRILPSAWARYEIGAWPTQTVTDFDAEIEMFQFEVARAPITTVIWYEQRQEYHEGNYDNTSYSVALGAQTPFTVPVVSRWAARNEPLVIGLDFFHRSDHALAPPEPRLTNEDARTTPLGLFLQHSEVNIIRFRFQTLGWDAPYRYKASYEKNTQWLGVVDWRATVGISQNKFSHLRGNPQGQPAEQVAANVDLASLQGFVLYAQAEYSLKQESPDYYAEFGVKRPKFRIFGRAEDYRIFPATSRGGVFYMGFGFDL